MSKAVVYARLSRNRNGQKSDTLEDQIDGCRRIAEAEGWTIIETITDNDISGRRSDRGGFARLGQMVAGNLVDVVLVRDVERLFRNAPTGRAFRTLCADHDTDIRTWQGMQPRLTDAGGVLQTGISDLMAEEYALSVSKNVKNWHLRRAKAGKANVPGTMFGERSEAEAEVVRELAEMALRGTSLKAMCRSLNGRGIKTTRGNDWSPTTVRNLLTNPRLAGILVSHGEELGEIADYEPILDRETHERVKLVLTKSAIYASAPRGRKPHLLTGILVCSSCGRDMRKSNNGTHETYRCVAESPCPKRMTIVAGGAEGHVAMETFRRVKDQPTEQDEAKITAATVELAGIRAKKLALTESFMQDLIDKPMLDLRLKELKAREAEVEGTIQAPISLADMSLVDLFDLPNDPAWMESQHEQTRAVIEMAVERVLVLPARTRGPKFDPERLEIQWRPEVAPTGRTDG